MKNLIKSIKSQTIQDFEVIFVDNASTDDSIKYIKKNMPKAKIIALKENLWFCKGNNIGYKHAKGKYVIISNSDIIFSKNYLEKVFQQFEKYPHAGIISSIYFPFYSPINKIKNCNGGGLLPLPLTYVPADINEIRLNMMSGPCFAIKNKIVDYLYLNNSIVYDDESFLSMQVLTRNYEIIGSNEVIVQHYHEGSSKNIDSAFKAYRSQKNLLRHFFITFNKRTILTTIPFLIIKEICSCLLLLKTPKNLIAIQKANLSVILSIPEIIKERNLFQSKRKINDKKIIEVFLNGKISRVKRKKVLGAQIFISILKIFFKFLLNHGYWE